MTKGKYKRKRENAKKSVKTQATDIPMDERKIVGTEQEKITTTSGDKPKWNKDPMKVFKWIATSGNSNIIIAFFTAALFFVGVLQWEVTSGQLSAAIHANALTQRTLGVSQRAYVTIGKKEGGVAEFIVPSVPEQDAELVMYFQNSGHLPATFTWGAMAAFKGKGSKKNSGIIYTHPFTGLAPRTRDKKTGSLGGAGETYTIAGDSIFVSTLGTISRKDLAELPANEPSLLILGMYEYCDELGTHFTRDFALRYRNNAPTSGLSFDLASDTSFGTSPTPKDTDTIEYLPPCETLTEREQGHHQKKTLREILKSIF